MLCFAKATLLGTWIDKARMPIVLCGVLLPSILDSLMGSGFVFGHSHFVWDVGLRGGHVHAVNEVISIHCRVFDVAARFTQQTHPCFLQAYDVCKRHCATQQSDCTG
jgi:hypothetical protein